MNMTGAIRWIQNRNQAGDPQHFIDEAWEALEGEVVRGSVQIAVATDESVASIVAQGDKIFTQIEESAQAQLSQMQEKQRVSEENVRRIGEAKEKQVGVLQKMHEEAQRIAKVNAELQNDLKEQVKAIQEVPSDPGSQVLNRALRGFERVACDSLAGRGDNLRRSKTGVVMGPRKSK